MGEKGELRRVPDRNIRQPFRNSQARLAFAEENDCPEGFKTEPRFRIQVAEQLSESLDKCQNSRTVF